MLGLTQMCGFGAGRGIPPFTGGWTSRSGPLSASLGIAHNGTVFCVPSWNGVLRTSPDGINWTDQPSLAATSWGTAYGRAIAWNGSVFCLAGDLGHVATSPDGMTWTYRGGLRSTGWGTVAEVRTIIWTGQYFIAGGYSGKIARSSNGITWTYYDTLAFTEWGAQSVYSIGYNGSILLALGNFRAATSSNNGATWTYQTTLSSTLYGQMCTSVACNGSVFAIGGSLRDIITTADGTSGTVHTISQFSSSNVVQGMIWDGNLFIAVGCYGHIATSPDGATWTYSNSLNSTAFSTSTTEILAWDGKQNYVVVGDANLAATSP